MAFIYTFKLLFFFFTEIFKIQVVLKSKMQKKKEKEKYKTC